MTRTPARIQHVRGVRLPSSARLVAKQRWNHADAWPTPLIGSKKGAEERLTAYTYALARYRIWLDQQLRATPAFLEELRGHDLACRCLAPRCPTDILLEVLATTGAG